MASEETEELIFDNELLAYKEKAEEILNNGTLLEYADNYFDKFIVHEEANRKVLYLALLNKNQILIRGESSQGKTHLAKNVLLAIPKNRYDNPAGFSEASPKYYFETINEEVDIIFVPEFEGRPEQNHVFRFSCVDDGGGKFIISEMDKELGRFMPRVIETGVKTILSTSVNVDIDAQDISRSWILYPDPSVEQTKGICRKQGDDFVNADQIHDYFFEQQVLWQVYEDLRVKDFEVVCPFYQVGSIIEMPFDSWFMRRENPRIINLIKNIARVNYKRRVSYILTKEVKGEWKDVNYLIADIEDIHQALYLLNEINAGVSTGLSPAENKMLELINMMSSKYPENRVGTKEVLLAMQESGWYVECQDYVGDLLNRIFKKGFLFKEENPYDRRSNLFSLTSKKRDFVKIFFEKLQPAFVEWLDSREEEAREQITHHSNYPKLLGNSVISKEAFLDSLLAKETDKKDEISSSETTRQLLGNRELPSSEEIPSSEKLGNNKPTKTLLSEKKYSKDLENNCLVTEFTEISKNELLMKLFVQLEHAYESVYEEEFLQLASQYEIEGLTREYAKEIFDKWKQKGIIFPLGKKGKYEDRYKKV